MKPKPTIVVQKKQPYHCFDHDVRYGLDDLMCPKCEHEICEAHDIMELLTAEAQAQGRYDESPL